MIAPGNSITEGIALGKNTTLHAGLEEMVQRRWPTGSMRKGEEQ